MRDARFGGSSAGLLQRLRPARVGVADLRDVACAVLPSLASPGLRLDVVQRSGSGSVVVLEEDERRVRVHLDELADDMTRVGVPPTSDGIAAALVAPERMLARIAATGLDLPDMHVVVTPSRPVACAGPGIAARLAGETTEASVTLPWRSLADLPWI